MSSLDYGKPIEAVHHDGSVSAAKVMGYESEPSEPYALLVEGFSGMVLGYADGSTAYGMTIRNVTEPKGLTTNETLPSDEISQPLALRMAKVIRILAECEPCGENESEKKLIALAQAIREDLPPETLQSDSDAVMLTADQAAMLRKVLAAIGGCVGTTIGHQTFFVSAQVVQDARDALALLPEPVDADLVEARECVAAVYEAANRSDLAKITRDGGQDKRLRVQSALAAIRRGRALERDSREG